MSSIDPGQPPEANSEPGGTPGGRRGLATPAVGDLDLAGTIAGTAEELGYATVWTDDRRDADGLDVAAAMLQATSGIRVGVGPIACDRRPAGETAARLKGHGLDLRRLMLVVGQGEGPVSLVASTLAGLRDLLGDEVCLGVAGPAEAMCRLGGEIADLVLLEWMSPDRIRWARDQIERGRAARAKSSARDSPEVAAYVRVAFGDGASLRLSAAAGPYASMPRFAENFSAMGSAAVGVAAADPSRAEALLEPYTGVLDEVVIKPVVTLPSSASPALGEVFEALSVLLEIGHALGPAAAGAGASG
jgi:alkanesulfonate monooxygenase SsuD/methylene tetrahydromethanopterin reductase-like flavin-dependent oxidoreductase (luciferase family)